MRYMLYMTVLCCLAQSAAAAQQMRDLSLSVEETLRQKSSKPSNPFGNQRLQPQLPNTLGGNVLPMSPLELQNHTYDEQRPRFMDSYCDPNFKAGIANPSLQSCLDTSQRQSCERFRQLTPDIQATLDKQIGCFYGTDDQPGSIDACKAYDSQRLQLIKKYWQQQEAVYSLVFLPDMVINAAAHCGRGQGQNP